MPDPLKNRRLRRRRDAARKLRRAAFVVRRFAWHMDEQDIALRGRQLRDHLAACSCPRCGNPRRSRLSRGWQKLSIQERRARLD